MRRRIPKSRKHNKLKPVDPCSKSDYTVRKRGICNLPPESSDDQHIPRKLQELIKMKNVASTRKVKKKKKQKDGYISVRSDKYEDQQKGMTKPLKYVPERMKQKRNESESHFIWRIQQLTNRSMAEAQMEAKYGVDATKGTEELEVNSADGATKPSRKQLKRKLIEQKKKEKWRKKLEDKVDDYEHLADEIKFGEVVTEPPKLIVPTKSRTHLKAGQKQLKLKSSR